MTITDPLAGLKADRFLDRRYHWLVFRAFNAYRLILAALLLVALALDDQGRLFGRQNPTLFLDAALGCSPFARWGRPKRTHRLRTKCNFSE